MPRIFISYSRKDEVFARRLASDLDTLGADIWLDVDDIPAGMNWSTAIQQGLDVCTVMLVILSPDSMASINVEKEWQYFLDQRKTILPILWQPTAIHFQLNRVQYIDFYQQSYDKALVELHTELRKHGIRLQSPSSTRGRQAAFSTQSQPARRVLTTTSNIRSRGVLSWGPIRFTLRVVDEIAPLLACMNVVIVLRFTLGWVSLVAIVPSLFSSDWPGGALGSIQHAIASVIGHGQYALPLLAMPLGFWWLVIVSRMARELPVNIEFSFWRVFGVAIWIEWALACLQYMDMLDEGQLFSSDFQMTTVRHLSYDLAVSQGRGGGWLGHSAFVLLIEQFAPIGTISILIMWFVLGVMFTFGLTMVEIVDFMSRELRHRKETRARMRAEYQALRAERAAARPVEVIRSGSDEIVEDSRQNIRRSGS